MSPFGGQVKRMQTAKWQTENSESADDKENVQNRCSTSFDFELVSSLLEKRTDNSATTPDAIEYAGTIPNGTDVVSCHHSSSSKNSSEKDRLGSTTENIGAETSNHLLESFLLEEVPHPTVQTPTKVVINPLKKLENTVLMSPTSTILTLKKGQRIKDGMILMLTGQVDRRKQLLLGAQVRMQNTLRTFHKIE